MTDTTVPNPYLVAGFTPSDLTPAQVQARYDLMNSMLALLLASDVPIIDGIGMLSVVAFQANAEVQCRVAKALAAAPTPAAPTPSPQAPTPPAAAPVPVAGPAPQPVMPGPDWVDAVGETYEDWLAATAQAQLLATNLGVPYTPGPTPTFSPPSTGG